MMFWGKSKSTECDVITQKWILEGLKNAPDGFYIIQESSIFISPKLLDLLGIDASQAKLMNIEWWHNQLHPDDKEWVIKYIKDRKTGANDQRQVEYRLRHQSGHWVTLLVNSYVYQAKGQINCAFMGIVTDVSSYRILHDQLEKTIEEGEKISQAKSHFIASLNHELRTPLNGILGMVNFLKDSSLNPEQQGFIDNIAASAQLLLSLVNDILDVSKISAGKLDLEKCDFDLHKTLHSTTNLLKPVAILKGLTFDLKIHDDVPHWVSGDQVRLQQVIVNLLSNAIKFTETGKITLLVQLRSPQFIISDDLSGEKTMNLILFKVIDTGPGIPATVLPKLFQDFTQASSSVVRTHGGTGLGLSICRKLVSLMGGEIGVQSTLAKGSTFWFSIPYELSQDHHERESPPLNLDWQNPQIPFHVLIAEDNMINQQVIQGLIQNLGGHVTIANNGQEIINLMSLHGHQEFDLIFMDINMPQVDGYQATTRIREMKHGKKIPIIACTADSMTNNWDEFRAKGFTDVIHKPISKGTLQEIFTQYLGPKFLEPPENKQEIEAPHQETTKGQLSILLDHDFIQTLKDDLGDETVSHLISLYKTDGQKIIDQITNHVVHKVPVTESHHEPHALAHTLAGMSENLGFKAVGQMARQIMGAHKKTEDLPHEWIEDLQDHFRASLRDATEITK